MKKIILILSLFSFSLMSYGQEYPEWMKKDGWVSFYTICQTQNKTLGKKSDCSKGPKVTDANTFMENIYWAGRVIDVYYDVSKAEFTMVKVKVNWISRSSDYSCEQTLTRGSDEIKEFTHRSVSLHPCN